MKVKHTITISFTTDEALLNHPAIRRLADDMEVQIESLVDGTYDDEEDCSTEGIDTNIADVDVQVESERA